MSKPRIPGIVDPQTVLSRSRIVHRNIMIFSIAPPVPGTLDCTATPRLISPPAHSSLIALHIHGSDSLFDELLMKGRVISAAYDQSPGRGH